MLTSGITHRIDGTTLNLADAGTYKITFSVSGVQPNQMALYLDGDLVPGSIYGSGAGTQSNTGQAVITIVGDNTLTLKNHTSTAAVDLEAGAGGTGANTNASLTIEKIG